MYQLETHNKSSVFVGDDTWLNLFPEGFKRSYPFPSFDVKDLDTVDLGVESRFPTELKSRDFDVLIGHFLGVDHAGHRYGPNHPEMARKLLEMNEFLEETLKWWVDPSTKDLFKDTLFVVIGRWNIVFGWMCIHMYLYILVY